MHNIVTKEPKTINNKNELMTLAFLNKTKVNHRFYTASVFEIPEFLQLRRTVHTLSKI